MRKRMTADLKVAKICGFRGVTNATARIRDVGHHLLTFKTVLSGAQREELEMTSFTDTSFPYVLICSTFGTIVSLASVWIATAQSFAPVLGA